MSRVKGFAASLAIAAVALVGLAPAAGAVTNIGTTPPGTLAHVCVTIRGVLDTTCVNV